MKLVQLSDIHWRSLHRHEEYNRVFSTLFQQLTLESPDQIVITGDVFHTKTQNISPEVVDRLVWMFNELSRIAPVHTILGNHDGNLTNHERQDVLSPIITALNNPRINLYKQSGFYPIVSDDGYALPFGFFVYSCFDKVGWSSVEPISGITSIALYHGAVRSCLLDNGSVLFDGEVDVDMFRSYDVAMLGDIHKQQFLDYRTNKTTGEKYPWIGYPGSLVQQNHGETRDKGYYVWEVDRDINSQVSVVVKFVELPNKSPFISVPWFMDSENKWSIHSNELLDSALEGTTQAKLRLITDKHIPFQIANSIRKELKNRYDLTDVTFKTIGPTATTGLVKPDGTEIQKTAITKDPGFVCELYRQVTEADNLSPSVICSAEQIIEGYLTRIGSEEEGTQSQHHWTIKELRFDNLFQYGEGNSIDFQKVSGVVGLLGANKSGKSSVIGSLMLGLFNTTDRKPVKTSHIINKSKQQGSVDVLFNVGGKDYLASRVFVKQQPSSKKPLGQPEPDRATSTLNLWQIVNNNEKLEIKPENDDTKTDTDKAIRKLIGSPTDFCLTTLSSQGDAARFIYEGPTQRKAILNRLLGLDVFDKVAKLANDDVASREMKLGGSNNVLVQSTVFSTRKRLENLNHQLDELDNECNQHKAELKSLNEWLNQHAETIRLQKQLTGVKQTRTTLESKLRTVETELQLKRSEQSVVAEHLLGLNANISDIEQIEIVVAKTNKALECLNQQTKQLDMLMVKETKAKKNAGLLTMVPCGSQYPQCKFIEEAHRDSRLIKESLEPEIMLITHTLSTLQSEISELESRGNKLKLEELKKQKSQFDQATAKHEALTEQLVWLEKRRDECSTELKTVIENEQQLFCGDPNAATAATDHQAKVVALEKTVSSKENRRSNLLIDIGITKHKLEEAEKTKAEFETLSSELCVYGSVAKAFSKTGIPALVLKTQLPAINNELEKLLENVAGFNVELETDVGSNSLDINIVDGHSKRPIELGCGMEIMLAALAIRVALIRLSTLTMSDMFIIDEGFGTLDEENLSKCLQFFSVLKSMFRIVLVVSHVAGIKDVVDHVLLVNNDGVESKIFC